MSDLTEFLLARIAEDEASASDWLRFEVRDGRPGNYAIPERVLAECDAKRRAVELAGEATGLDMQVDSEFQIGLRDTAADPYLGDLLLRALALPYAGHPDYDERWRP